MSDGREPNERETPAQGDLTQVAEEAIDFRRVREIAQGVEGMTLAGTNRAELDEQVRLVRELVRRLVRADYPDRTRETMTAFRAAYRVLDSPTAPSSLDSDYLVYTHIKNLARAAGALADVLDPPVTVRGFVARPGLPPELIP